MTIDVSLIFQRRYPIGRDPSFTRSSEMTEESKLLKQKENLDDMLKAVGMSYPLAVEEVYRLRAIEAAHEKKPEPLEDYYTHYVCECGFTQAWGPHADTPCVKCGGKLKLISEPKV
jgi:hypothetical protein